MFGVDDIAEGEGEEQEEQEDVDDQAMWRTSLARESSCSQNGTWTRLNQATTSRLSVRLVSEVRLGR